MIWICFSHNFSPLTRSRRKPRNHHNLLKSQSLQSKQRAPTMNLISALQILLLSANASLVLGSGIRSGGAEQERNLANVSSTHCPRIIYLVPILSRLTEHPSFHHCNLPSLIMLGPTTVMKVVRLVRVHLCAASTIIHTLTSVLPCAKMSKSNAEELVLPRRS